MAITNKPNNDKFEENFERIFGNKKVQRGSFVQDPETGKLVPRETRPPTPRPSAPMVMKGLEPFKSPIDGSIISTRNQLAAHNKKHGVTNVGDYSGGYIEKKAHERVNAGEKYLKETRRADIHDAFNRHT